MIISDLVNILQLNLVWRLPAKMVQLANHMVRILSSVCVPLVSQAGFVMKVSLKIILYQNTLVSFPKQIPGRI